MSTYPISPALLSKPIIHPTLDTPLDLGSLTLKNRVVMASLTRNRGVVSNPVNATYYAQRASTGLIVSEGTLVTPQGTEWIDCPGLYDERTTAGWTNTVAEVHKAGGVIFAQLWHLGRVCHPHLQANVPNVGPSAVKAQGGKFRLLQGQPGYVTPVAIEKPQAYAMLYRHAAENARRAGFDGVELHAANGYLVNQFIDSKSNVRTDAYGGSPENRARFALEIIDHLIAVYGADRVGIKLSPSGGYNDMQGGEPDLPTYTYLVTQLAHRGIAYVQVTRYLDDFSAGGAKVDVLALGQLLKNSTTKFLVNGGFDAAEAELWVKQGKADAIVFGRPILATPDFKDRAIRGVQPNTDLKFNEFYVPKDNNPALGYTDYPFYQDGKVE
ncbi:hypothetical protein PhCBS80983_g05646 [Powellomyces hirtus]|uniref:NADH:flavin oxidoreductase/NADH oxidase N-terminal domain-containing protein n=1 Tax=Powellomyces hirtus TaxID=109895 RepID=A0A507DVT9_9FUNG|nr:hypothetical protein PhCBS80983_g05646 [Powellomyces hirtus]